MMVSNTPSIITAMQEIQTSKKTIRLSRKGVERLDLLLLTIEALDLNGGEAMLWTCHQLGLKKLFPNRVELWRQRCHNPLRRSTRRENLSPIHAESLIRLVSSMSERLYPLLRQLLSEREPQKLSEKRWQLFDNRLRELIEERLNTRRGSVKRLLDSKTNRNIQRQLINTLAFASGQGGIERLSASLQDTVN